MTVLVPMDGSDTSFRALEFAADYTERYGTDLHVVHVTDSITSDTEELLDRIRDRLAELGLDDDPEVKTDSSKFRAQSGVGEVIVAVIDDGGYEHVVMGHHGQGAAETVLLGSASQTVIEESDVPVTLVP